MKAALVSLMTAALLWTGSTALAEDAPRTLTVTGTGTVTAAADTATLYVVIDSEGPTAGQAARDNGRTAAEVKRAVVAAGAAEDELTTANYTLRPEYDEKRPRTIRTYRAQHSLKVVVRDAALAGAVSDAALAAGAGRIGSVVFSLADQTPYQTEALQRAAAGARKESERIAAALGASITGVLSATTSVRSHPPRGLLRNASAKEENTALVPEKQDITATVTIVYEIE